MSSDEMERLFVQNRPRLRRIARHILGDADAAEDVVQETWLKAMRTPALEVRNPEAWLATITTRASLDWVRSRKVRRARSLDLETTRDAVACVADPSEGAESLALKADDIHLALLVLLQRLGPLERVAFVLHDLFGVAFQEIGPLISRSPQAARQLASRGRRKIRGPARAIEAEPARHLDLARSFLHAAQTGDMQALLRILHPDVVLLADGPMAGAGPGAALVGADRVAGFFSRRAAAADALMVDGAAGFIVEPDDQLRLVVRLVITDGRIVSLQAITDPDAHGRLQLSLPPRA